MIFNDEQSPPMKDINDIISSIPLLVRVLTL